MNLVLDNDLDRATCAEGDATVGHWDVPSMDVSTGDRTIRAVSMGSINKIMLIGRKVVLMTSHVEQALQQRPWLRTS